MPAQTTYREDKFLDAKCGRGGRLAPQCAGQALLWLAQNLQLLIAPLVQEGCNLVDARFGDTRLLRHLFLRILTDFLVIH